MSAAPTQLEKREIIMSNSTAVGLKSAALAAGLMGAAVTAAHHYSPFFRHRLGVSGKVGFVAMAGLATFNVAAEQDLLKGSRNPDEYINELQGTQVAAAVNHGRKALPVFQQLGNFVYDHPFRMIAVTALPAVGGIFLYQNTNTNISFSQKIMHTRIYGQGTCVVVLLSTMAFYDYMSRRGRFE
ncbi:Aste57867_21527 [Aphanomyces stellatus]|uniref:Aste57867_21527 protein n=1 Tax=Aphanomyces stellatus TaxID=120398 RepID=A0A485LID9_9STRA|nr:hypothetical protein As57867_021458 [Aphanomyces stellatus]VFT98197.1 Aste57867_21527 [Aphanomyces stellatus]